MNVKLLFKAILSIFITIIIFACASQPINIDYIPEKDIKSALSTIKPMSLVIQVEEQYEDKFEGIMASIHKEDLNKSITTVFFEALKNEFENNGHKVLLAGEGTANARVEMAINKFFSYNRDFIIKGTITIKNLYKPSENLTKVIAAREMGNSEIRKEAIKEFVWNFSNNAQIIKFLQSCQPE